MNLTHTLFLWSQVGCQPEKPLAQDTGITTPGCMDSDTLQSWERLGSPIEFSDLTPVAPNLIVVDEQLWLYLSLRDNLSDSVVLTTSTDGLTWSDPVFITGLDNQSIKHLNVAQDEDGFRGFIGGGNISRATSTDGIAWTTNAENVIPNSDFDAWGQLYPTQNNSGSRIWYSGFSGETYGIGLATKDNGTWTNRGTVLTHSPSSEYDNTAVAQSSIVETDSGLMMWYGGYDTSNTDPGPWRILAATSSDGIEWTKLGLVLDLFAEEEAWSVREPSVAVWNSTLWMAYISMGSDGVYRPRLARCTN